EHKALWKVRSADPNHPVFQHCPQLHGYFACDSDQGLRVYLVTNVHGLSLSELALLQPNRSFSLTQTERIVKRTLLALDYLHRRYEYVHT
ncbi:hypothetical protein OBBRIDRAFT_705631, partial [Obba rivulosa]